MYDTLLPERKALLERTRLIAQYADHRPLTNLLCAYMECSRDLIEAIKKDDQLDQSAACAEKLLSALKNASETMPSGAEIPCGMLLDFASEAFELAKISVHESINRLALGECRVIAGALALIVNEADCSDGDFNAISHSKSRLLFERIDGFILNAEHQSTEASTSQCAVYSLDYAESIANAMAARGLEFTKATELLCFVKPTDGDSKLLRELYEAELGRLRDIEYRGRGLMEAADFYAKAEAKLFFVASRIESMAKHAHDSKAYYFYANEATMLKGMLQRIQGEIFVQLSDMQSTNVSGCAKIAKLSSELGELMRLLYNL